MRRKRGEGNVPRAGGHSGHRRGVLSRHRVHGGWLPHSGGTGAYHCAAAGLSGAAGVRGRGLSGYAGPEPAERGSDGIQREEKAGVPGFRRAAVYPLRGVRTAGAVRQRPSAALGGGALYDGDRPEAGAGRAEAGRAGAAGYRRKSQPGDGDHRRGAGAPQHGAGGAAPGGADRKRKGQQPDKGTAPGTGAGAEALYAGAYRAAARQ